MKVTFLEADVPLTKTFFLKDGKIEKIGHPKILNYTSHEETVSDIEELRTKLVHHAALGHCFLKGNVNRPLADEPRAGTTNPNDLTQILLPDIDGIKGAEDIDDVLKQIKLSGADYIVQYSSSMGVLPDKGISAHVFIILDKPVAPAVLKQYLIQWNLTVPLLQANLGLTRTYNALRWSLDITTCQNDKLIYIAPPILKDGVEDGFKGERIQLVKGKKRRLVLPEPFPNAETNQSRTQDKLNELRGQMGLEKRAKTMMKVRGSVEYLARPDRAVVTGIREKGDNFVYLNLNGGDSWGYYHPASNPEFIYNFKNEPTYKTSELLPDYWADVKVRMNDVRTDEGGKQYLAFRDFKSSAYYNGIYDDKARTLSLAMARGKEQLSDFMMQYDQPAVEVVPDWNLSFNPHSEKIVDAESKTVNMYIPSTYMRAKPRVVKECPSQIGRVIMNVVGGDEECYEHYMNWLAVIMQFKIRTQTCWCLHGVQGTGKGVLLDHILRPLFGMDYVVAKRIREIDSQFNGFLEQTFILWVDEAEQNVFNSKGPMNADLKNYVTEGMISIRKMHTNPYMAENFLNWIFNANVGHIVRIDPDDRRFNVAPYQSEKIVITDEDLEQIKTELPDFHSYLWTRKADKATARRALNNQAKQAMTDLNLPAIDIAARAIRTGDLEHFWAAQTQGTTAHMPAWQKTQSTEFTKLLNGIVNADKPPKCLTREELFLMLDFTIGGMPRTPMKFASMMKHHKLDIVAVWRDGRTLRGVAVDWKVKPEWKNANNVHKAAA